MFNHAKEGRVRIGATTMNYVRFGEGKKTLVIIPGLGDAFKSVKGLSPLLSYVYRRFAKEYTVYIFSRKKEYEVGYSTQDMAKDQAVVMKKLGLTDVYLMGISQGGMIAQHLTSMTPQLVDKLVLVVTMCRQNRTVQTVIGNWRRWAYRRNFKSVLIDLSEKCYEEESLKRMRLLYPFFIVSNIVLNRRKFLIQATSCLKHNSYKNLTKIQCPTLIIGGGNDGVVGTEDAAIMARKIPNSKLRVLKGMKHGLYYEDVRFKEIVIDFLNKN